MQQDSLLDPLKESGQIGVIVWRCFNCGENIDHLILQNRQYKQPPIFSKARLNATRCFKASGERVKEKFE